MNTNHPEYRNTCFYAYSIENNIQTNYYIRKKDNKMVLIQEDNILATFNDFLSAYKYFMKEFA